MTRESDVARLAEAVAALAPRYHIEKVWLFGSRARGTNREDGDFDVCVLPSERFTFSDYFYFEKELSEVLGAEVHVMTRGALESSGESFRRGVVRDEILVYGLPGHRAHRQNGILQSANRILYASFGNSLDDSNNDLNVR